MKEIVKGTPAPECSEQEANPASVRTIAERAVPYDGGTMNVTLKPFDFAQAVARAGLNTSGQPLQRGAAVEGGGFQQALTQALGAVSKSQDDSTSMQREVQLDNPSVSIEQTMVAMQKAQIGFSAALQVRNKMVQAYSDIMSMQV
jgi:flagellar hook-basal body complex protein FliE